MSENGKSNLTPGSNGTPGQGSAPKSLVERLADRHDGDVSAQKGAQGQSSASTGTRSAAKAPAGQTPGGLAPGGLAPRSEARPAHSGGRTRHIATIDIKRLKKLGFVTPDGGRSQIVEEFRAIKRPLLRRAFESGGQGRDHLIMVTSARPGEGKSFCSINLAMSIASERGLNVLLVDGDVVKSDVPDILGFRSDSGFLDLLVDRDLDPSDVLVRTNIPNLSVLPSGHAHDHATELLAGPAMADLISDLATRYSDRVIIFNAPPVLASSEAAVLASWVGQVVLVVEADQTGRGEVAQALHQLGEDANVNFVLNKVTDRRATERYGAYSYYGRSK
jgi:exopolysaccharide/PEP-CTERM locus tyrosine autokinase